MPLPKVPLVVIAALTLSLSAQFAIAKRKPAARLIKQTARFDTSVLPKRSHFELKIKHTEFIHPPETATLLHETARVVNLRGDADATVLRGQVKENNPASPLNTLEHGVKPRFNIDLGVLTAKIAPDVARQMDAQIAAARRRVADDVARQEQVMEHELHTRQPRPDVPPIPARGSISVAKTDELSSELTRSKQSAQAAANGAGKKLEEAVSQGRAWAQSIVGTITGTGTIPPNSGHGLPAGAMPPPPKVSVTGSEQQLTAELNSVKHQSPSAAELNAQLDAAKKRAQTTVSYAQPAMDAILTHLRPVQPVSMQAVPNIGRFPQPDASEVIEWDEWHARFAKLAHDPILNEVGKLGNSSGKNAIQITVSRDHHLTAQVTQKSNDAFDRAMLQAYQSLSGNPALEFPHDSQRDSITFLIDNEHQGTGVPSGVNSQTAVGDKEVVHFQPKP